MRVITPSSYHYDDADRALADEIMRRLELAPNTVTLIELDETGVVIEQLVRDDEGRLVPGPRGFLTKRWRA